MKKFFNKKLVVFIVLACLLLTAFILLPQIAHAQNTDTLHNNLTHNGNDHEAVWVFSVWAVMLGLADVIIVLILLVIAIVNILHLSYDTYALKKSLPLLIGGIIASHFSVLICRMIVDAAGVLEQQFMATNTNAFVTGLLCTMGIGSPVTGPMSFAFLNPGAVALALIVLLLVIIFFAIAIGVLSFLLWFRKTVIFLLVAVSPLAFILYAFPPTQGLFKQWWSQFVKWVFMGPIMVALMWMASEIGKTNCATGAHFNIGAALAAGGVMYAAAIVPLKMGGAIMGAASNLGKWATGSGKGGYLRKPGDDAIQSQKDMAKKRTNRFINDHNILGMGSRRAKFKKEQAIVDEELKGSEGRSYHDLNDRTKHRFDLRARQAREGYEDQEAEEAEAADNLEAGVKLAGLTDADYQTVSKTTNVKELARRYMDSTNNLAVAKSALEKRRDLDRGFASIRDEEIHTAVKGKMKEDLATANLKAGGAVADIDGVGVTRNGTTEVMTYADAINVAAESRAKAKTASSTAEKAAHDADAEKVEASIARYRGNNATAYDYEAILDRNTNGRRMKEIQQRVSEEAEITAMGANGHTIVSQTRENHGTSEYQCTADDEDRALVDKWSDIDEGTAKFAVKQHHMAVGKFIDRGARGDAEGVTTIKEMIGRIQEAHNNDSAKTGVAAPNVGGDINTKALASMNDDQRALAVAALGSANGDITKLKTDSSDEGRANMAYIEQTALALKSKLGLDKSPGGDIASSKATAKPRA